MVSVAVHEGTILAAVEWFDTLFNATSWLGVLCYAVISWILLYRSFDRTEFRTVLRALSLAFGGFVFTTAAGILWPEYLSVWRLLGRPLVLYAAWCAFWWWRQRNGDH